MVKKFNLIHVDADDHRKNNVLLTCIRSITKWSPVGQCLSEVPIHSAITATSVTISPRMKSSLSSATLATKRSLAGRWLLDVPVDSAIVVASITFSTRRKSSPVGGR
ncbi:hypothetical protein EJ110_NYTH43623 [Nymphaea thermarum]|nr:hypothetical protein EJ110_NYTH43623 [Nymphaea thermarum]